jgi:hypothetical protein
MQPTRQLLDELDSLMQRMLALPVSQLEEEIRASTERSAGLSPADEEGPIYRRLAVEEMQPTNPGLEPNPGTDPADRSSEDEPLREMGLGPELRLATAHIPDEAEDRPPASEAHWEETNNPTGTTVEEAPPHNLPDWESGLPASPEVLAAIRERPLHPADAEGRPALISPPSRGLPERPNASVPEPVVAWWLLPLVWCNHLFDYCTFALGEPGAWLRSGPGRAVLGWCGLLLLAGAVAWAVLVEFG